MDGGGSARHAHDLLGINIYTTIVIVLHHRVLSRAEDVRREAQEGGRVVALEAVL